MESETNSNTDSGRAEHLSAALQALSMPPLVRVSEVEREHSPDSSLGTVVRWMREYLAKPHPDLGRKGPVCPFVPVSLELDTVWLSEVSDSGLTADDLTRIITDYRDLFLRTEPTTMPASLQKSFLVIFPALRERGPEGASLVDKVQYNLKRYFVEMGLMIGEFHANSESPGLRNPDFRPLRCPMPMLAIRHMVESDFPFLARKTYPPRERSWFLRAYLSYLGTSLLPGRFDQAFEALISAEAEMWIAGIRAGTVAPVTQTFVLDTALNLVLAGVAP
jgi:hypothetical protein